MSDLITEEYQEQVLVDLSEIKDSVTTDSGYQDKVLNDLDEIKDSVSEEQEYYDKEYQKKVLGSLRSIQKSVEALNVDYVELVGSNSNTSRGYFVDSSTVVQPHGSYSNKGICFDCSDLDVIYLTWENPYVNTGYYASKYFFASFDLPQLYNYVNGRNIPCYDATNVNSSLDKLELVVPEGYPYFYMFTDNSTSNTLGVVYKAIPRNDESENDVTSGSAVMVDGIDTLIQITTFQGFASALLTGILLFLVFVKGLRR